MNDIEEIPDSQPSIAPTIRDCVDCALKSDIIVHSSDGIRFAAHGQNLYSYSEAFPVSVAGPDDTDLPSASLPESSEVVSLLLQCMHLRRQPNVAKLPFVVLDELATAAEKYRVYSIMTVCAMSMASHVQQYPIDILRYATKYGYNDLANEAALFTVDFNLPTIKENFEKDSVIPYRWLEYREQWVSLLRSVQSEEPQAVILHKGGLAECPLWKPFYKDVLATVGWSSISLKGFNKTLQDKMQSKLQGACPAFRVLSCKIKPNNLPFFVSSSELSSVFCKYFFSSHRRPKADFLPAPTMIRCPYCDAVCAHKFSRTQNTQELEAHIESVHNWLAAVIRVENKTYISVRQASTEAFRCPILECASESVDRHSWEEHIYAKHMISTTVYLPMERGTGRSSQRNVDKPSSSRQSEESYPPSSPKSMVHTKPLQGSATVTPSRPSTSTTIFSRFRPASNSVASTSAQGLTGQPVALPRRTLSSAILEQLARSFRPATSRKSAHPQTATPSQLSTITTRTAQHQNFYIQVPLRRPSGGGMATESTAQDTTTTTSPTSSGSSKHTTTDLEDLSVERALIEDDREVYEDESLTTCRTVTGLYTPPTSPVKAGPSKLRRTRSLSPGSSAKRRKTCKALSKHWVEASFCVLVEVQGIRFKLPSDRLRRLSGWFQQVLEEQKYESAGEIIYLDHTGVTAPDFEKLLDALEKSFTFDKISPPLDEIVAIMRAATALRFEDQAAWAVRRLEALWPNQLSDISPVHRSYAIEAIEAARHCGLSTILKSAFYELVRGSSLPDVLTQHVNDGSLRAEDLSTLICARDKASARWLAVAAFHGSLEKFPPCSKAGNSHAPPVLPDLAPKNNGGINLGGNTVAMRRLKFEQSGIEEIPPMRQRVPRELGIVTRCISADINHLQRVHTTLVNTSGMLQRYLFDPVMGLQALSDAPWAKEGLCSDCVQTRRAVWRAERERLWAEMDEWFEGADKE